MRAPEVLRRAAPWAGRAVTILALGYLAYTAREHWAALSAWKPTARSWALLLACGVLYGVAMMFIGESWHQIVSGLSNRALGRTTTWPSYGVTQVAKYLPGNVFHLVGRHLWLQRQGVPQRAILTAAVWEAALLAASALGSSCLVVILRPMPLFGFEAAHTALVAAGGLAALLSALLLVIIVRRRTPRLADYSPRDRSLILSPAALLAFFLSQGAIYALLFLALDREPGEAAIVIAVLSWLIGYLTPGAPGGIGSREAVLVTLTTPLTGSPDALILAALFRATTTLGDAVCFGLCWLISRAAPRTAVADATAGTP